MRAKYLLVSRMFVFLQLSVVPEMYQEWFAIKIGVYPIL